MTPQQFISKWKPILANPLAGAQERALSQQHFIDLCELLGHPRPTDESFRFEKPVSKVTGEKGFAKMGFHLLMNCWGVTGWGRDCCYAHRVHILAPFLPANR